MSQVTGLNPVRKPANKNIRAADVPEINCKMRPVFLRAARLMISPIPMAARNVKMIDPKGTIRATNPSNMPPKIPAASPAPIALA